MAKLILTNAAVWINSVNLSDHCNKVEVAFIKDDVDTSAFGSTGQEQQQGVDKSKFKITFQQDMAAAKVDATLFPLWANGTEFNVAVRGDAANCSATNPEFWAVCKLFEYTPISGKKGDTSEIDLEFLVQRATSARDTTSPGDGSGAA